MKLIVFFALIVLSFIGSLLFSRNDFKKKNKPSLTIIKAIVINFIVLGLGSIWWFLTETDGISQGIGVLIYLGSFVGITIVNIIFIYVWSGGFAKNLSEEL